MQPPPEARLTLNWDGSPVAFNDTVSYSCDSDDVKFEIDMDLDFWNMTCLFDGSWDAPQTPEEWPICLNC